MLKRMNIMIPVDLYEDLREQSFVQKKSMSQIIVESLRKSIYLPVDVKVKIPETPVKDGVIVVGNEKELKKFEKLEKMKQGGKWTKEKTEMVGPPKTFGFSKEAQTGRKNKKRGR